jgi:hypothetical protein
LHHHWNADEHRQRSFGLRQEVEHITDSQLQTAAPGLCKALFIEGVFYEDKRVEGWEKGALGRPLVKWARRRKQEREHEQAERDRAEAKDREDRWMATGGRASGADGLA